MTTTFFFFSVLVLVHPGGKQLSLLPNAPVKKRGRPSGSRNRTKVARKLKYTEPSPTPPGPATGDAAAQHDAPRKRSMSAAPAGERKRDQLTCEDWQHAIYFVLLALGRIHDCPFKDFKK